MSILTIPRVHMTCWSIIIPQHRIHAPMSRIMVWLLLRILIFLDTEAVAVTAVVVDVETAVVVVVVPVSVAAAARPM